MAQRALEARRANILSQQRDKLQVWSTFAYYAFTDGMKDWTRQKRDSVPAAKAVP